MYPSKYKSDVRIRSVQDALRFPIHKKTKADLFLYCLDLYDLYLSHMERPERSRIPEGVKDSLQDFMIQHFVELNERIPGQMKGWTDGMFVYLCFSAFNTLTCRDMRVDASWMNSMRLRMTRTLDLSRWSFFDWCKSVDALERQWSTIPKDKRLKEYLDSLEYRASFFINQEHSGHLLDIPKFRIGGPSGKYRIHPSGVYECYSRMILLRRSLTHIESFSKSVKKADALDDTYMKTFFKEEERHLTIRKFRDHVSSTVLYNMLRTSERFRVSYDRRGSFVSPYAALANFRPLAMLDILSKSIAYDKPDQLVQNHHVPNSLYICTVHAYFSSTYSISFRDMFLCTEEKAWKYKDQIITSTVPIILEMCKEYHVIAQGDMYRGNGSFYHAFYIWVTMVKTMYNCILFNQLDLSRLCKKILEAPEVIAARKTTFVEYQWD